MAGVKDSTLQALRLRYNAALAAYQGCVRALTEASLVGTPPSAAQLQGEARASAELERARSALLAAMTEAITGRPAEPVPDDAPPPTGPRNNERDAE